MRNALATITCKLPEMHLHEQLPMCLNAFGSKWCECESNVERTMCSMSEMHCAHNAANAFRVNEFNA